METGKWLRAKEILEDLAEVAPDARASRIAAACAGDADLQAEVERLLALDDEADRYFGDLGTTLSQVDVAPAQVGVYRIVREIGHGGMGKVYLGERADGQFEQRVAIKIMREDLDDKLLQRFQDERRILAQLEHPGIAYLLDGGSLPDGRPYFVMEYVDGESITAYADRKRLDVEARLRLFREVCAAVAYAHRNLIVHRDLKPGNVMVEEDDQGQASIKLLDFGIARIIEQGIKQEAEPGADGSEGSHALAETLRTPAAPARTEHGARLLTPTYAAPEQLRGEAATTASDVYALGVLLYELLTGRRPFDGMVATRGEMERVILDEPPPAPSETARTLDAGVTGLRSLEPSRLARRLRGDLDSIVRKALHKQPEHRYASVGQFSGDIKRHLGGFAVGARRGGWLYHVGIFLRRYRWVVAAAVLVLLASLSLGALHIMRITQERDLARAETAKAEAVSQLLIGMFESADPRHARGREVTVREVLDHAATEIDDTLAKQPALRAQMLDIMGGIYARLGEYETAGELLDKGLALRRDLYGQHHPDVADSLQNLAVLAWMRGRMERAESLLRQALEQRLGFSPRDRLEIASTRNDLAAVLRRQGNLEESEVLYRQVLATRLEALGEGHADVATTRNNLAVLLGDQGNFDAAEALYRKVLASRRKSLGPVHPRLANSINNLASLLRDLQRFDEAEVLEREALAMRKTLYGEQNALVSLSLDNLGGALRGQGRYEEAGAYYRKALAIRRVVFGDDSPAVASSLNNLASLYRDQAHYEKAEPLYREAIAIYRTHKGADHPWTATSIKNLGELLLENGSPEAAQAQFSEALRIRKLNLPEHHWRVAEAGGLLGAALLQQGKLSAAEPLLQQAHTDLEQSRGAQDVYTRDALARLLACYEAGGMTTKAAALRARAPVAAP